MPSLNRSTSSNSSVATSTSSFMPLNRRAFAPPSSSGFRGGFEVDGEEIQRRLNSCQRRKHRPVTPRVPQLKEYTMTEEEMSRYFGAKYIHGAEQFWAIIEIIKFSPNNELLWKKICEIYHFLYGKVLDEKSVSSFKWKLLNIVFLLNFDAIST
uniref:Uncharacterized protein n=1 Tax=Panagrolaimus superbus TaxID=310955 RepID=A0A914YJ76_9BILA